MRKRVTEAQLLELVNERLREEPLLAGRVDLVEARKVGDWLMLRRTGEQQIEDHQEIDALLARLVEQYNHDYQLIK